jgi:hypothetical protein
VGNRREPRDDAKLPVRIFGTDADGRVFSEKVTTVNVSRQGVEVSGLKVNLKLDEIVGLTLGQKKLHFRVKWMGPAGTPKAGHAGLLNLNPEKPFWDLPLPAPAQDQFQAGSVERRKHMRVKCTTSVELHPEGASLIWGKASDLSVGGCYVEMPIPLKPATKLKVGVWVGKDKLWATGKVTNSTPGFGIGVQFTEIADKDKQLLAEFLKTIKED